MTPQFKLPPLLPISGTNEGSAFKGVSVGWDEFTSASEVLTIYLVDPKGRVQGIHDFFYSMVCYWLIPGHMLTVEKYQNHFYQTEKVGKKEGVVHELTVKVPKEKWSQVRCNLPNLAREIISGVASPLHANAILEAKGLSPSQQGARLYNTVLGLTQHPYHPVPPEILEEVHRFLFVSHQGFREVRSLSQLCRIVVYQFIFTRDLRRKITLVPTCRHLRLKLKPTFLYFPFGKKKVLSVVVAINLLNEYEYFAKSQVERAFKEVFPDSQIVSGSYLDFRERAHQLRFVYLEFERLNGFSIVDIRKLQHKLPEQLKTAVEERTPRLITPINEEELYRDIGKLSDEIRLVRDLPQAMIQFRRQGDGFLEFQVLLVRLLKNQSESLNKLCQGIPTGVRCVIEQVTPVGFLWQRHVKEAAVLRFHFDMRPFLRRDGAVDIMKARQFASEALKQIVGEFRDYNGGLLKNQMCQLEKVKLLIGESGENRELLIETLFYSITPTVVQSYQDPQSLNLLFRLILGLLRVNVGGESYIEKTKRDSDVIYCAIKTSNHFLFEEIKDGLKKLQFSGYEVVYTSFDAENNHYIGYLFKGLNGEQEGIFSTIREQLVRRAAEHTQHQHLRLNIPLATNFLDPRIAADRISGLIIKMLYEGLMRLDGDGKPQPAVAEKVEVSPDQKTYTFTLRRTTWSDGSFVTAQDFEYAWKRALEPAFKAWYSFLFYPIKNAEAINQGELSIDQLGLEVISDTQLKVTLEAPTPYFLALTTLWVFSPLRKELDRVMPGWAYYVDQDYICNGPFKPVEWQPQERLILAPNPSYRDRRLVKLSRIEISIFEDPDRTLSLFERGELDWAGDPLWELPTKRLPKLRKEGKLRSTRAKGIFIISLNVQRFPFTSRKIRCAFSYGIDRQKIIDQVLGGGEEPATSLIPPGPDSPLVPQFRDGDYERAYKLFEEGVDELGVTKSDLDFLTFTHSDHEEHTAIAHAVGKQWAELFGIKLKYESLPWEDFVDRLDRSDFLIGPSTCFAWYDDPNFFFELLKSCNHRINVTGWDHPAFKDLVSLANAEGDPIKRLESLRQAEAVVFDEMPLIPLYFYRGRYLVNPALKGVIVSETGQIDFRSAYFDF